MTAEELRSRVKENLRLETEDFDLQIMDIIRDVCDYCNLEDIPGGLEPYVRRKWKGIMEYEQENGSGYHVGIASIGEGDTSVSFNHTEEDSKSYVYGLNEDDKAQLNRYRKLRW